MEGLCTLCANTVPFSVIILSTAYLGIYVDSWNQALWISRDNYTRKWDSVTCLSANFCWANRSHQQSTTNLLIQDEKHMLSISSGACEAYTGFTTIRKQRTSKRLSCPSGWTSESENQNKKEKKRLKKKLFQTKEVFEHSGEQFLLLYISNRFPRHTDFRKRTVSKINKQLQKLNTPSPSNKQSTSK